MRKQRRGMTQHARCDTLGNEKTDELAKRGASGDYA